jgi:hypothetical protein
MAVTRSLCASNANGSSEIDDLQRAERVRLWLAEFNAYHSKQLADQALTHVTNSLAGASA